MIKRLLLIGCILALATLSACKNEIKGKESESFPTFYEDSTVGDSEEVSLPSPESSQVLEEGFFGADGFVIELGTEYSQQQVDDCALFVYSDKAVFTMDYELFVDMINGDLSTNITAGQYAVSIADQGELPLKAPVSSKGESKATFSYADEIEGALYYYYAYYLKGEDRFYRMTFCCAEPDFEGLKQAFDKAFESVTFN